MVSLALDMELANPGMGWIFIASVQQMACNPSYALLIICHTKRFPTDYERLKNTKICEKIGEKISEKIGHIIFGNRSKVNDLGVTQADYQIV